jgi:flagellar motor switch/type III secretory pathway protein FliN
MAKKKAATAKKAQARKAAPKKAAPAPAKAKQDNAEAIGGVRLTMTAELGRTRDTIGNVME